MRTRGTLIVAAVCAVLVAGCSSGSSKSANGPTTPTSPTTTATNTAAPATTGTTTAKPATPDPQVWLCKPDKAGDPCLSGMTATVIGPDGSRKVEQASAATNPKIDCFYVYPTVSAQPTPNANLNIDPAETGVAIAQASRYSQVCNVYAPMYRQETISGIFKPSAGSAAIAFGDVLSAWKDYLARYNDGRGVVLIGHSQGSFILRQLISKYIDPNAAVRSHVVSAILMGGNVIVPVGKLVGGDFKHLPACQSSSQTGCVIAFSSFDHTPPSNSLFGRARTAGEQVLCTNPAALAGGSGPVDPYLPARSLGGPVSFTKGRLAATPWVSYPDLFTAQCENTGGASWLQINDVRKAGDTRPMLRDALGPTWGLHLYDGNIALGNLVDIVRDEAAAFTG